MTLDADTGVLCYASDVPGIGGIIRERIEDFRVEEVSSFDRSSLSSSGSHLVFRLTKKNWDTHRLFGALAKRLGVSRERFSWAGTKDKRGITSQMVSINGITEEDLSRVMLKDCEIEAIGYMNRALRLGDLRGNSFRLVIRAVDLEKEECEERLKRISEGLENAGIPNFFGVQRFGMVRPITHLVGKHLVHKRFREGVMTYLSDVYEGESDEAKEARKFIRETSDFQGALKCTPKYLGFELAMLNSLAKDGDYQKALFSLPRNLRLMFIHAYQSYLFNLILSNRIGSGTGIIIPRPGDNVCYPESDGFPDTTRVQKVRDHNLEGINRLVRFNRAFVTLPIIGFETELSGGVQGGLEREVMEAEGVSFEDFRSETKEFNSSGNVRPAKIVMASPPAARVEEDENHVGKVKVELSFVLPKGSYATTLLREYMKC